MKTIPRHPTAQWCFGRDALIRDTVGAACEDGSRAFLFRRASSRSRPTLLLAATAAMGKNRANVREMKEIDVPVYVDLLRLAAGDGPREFFSRLSTLAGEACEKQIDGFLPLRDDERNRASSELDAFVSDMTGIMRGCGDVGCRFVFLLDEAKRIAGPRFPRGVQENLFALLYDPRSDLCTDAIAFVLAGAQDLSALLHRRHFATRFAGGTSLRLVRSTVCQAVGEMCQAAREVRSVSGVGAPREGG